MTRDQLMAEYKAYYADSVTHAEYLAGESRRAEIRALLTDEDQMELVKWLLGQITRMGEEQEPEPSGSVN